jgi:hypothetical protein
MEDRTVVKIHYIGNNNNPSREELDAYYNIIENIVQTTPDGRYNNSIEFETLSYEDMERLDHWANDNDVTITVVNKYYDDDEENDEWFFGKYGPLLAYEDANPEALNPTNSEIYFQLKRDLDNRVREMLRQQQYQNTREDIPTLIERRNAARRARYPENWFQVGKNFTPTLQGTYEPIPNIPQRPTVTTTPFPQSPKTTTTPFPQSPKTTTTPFPQSPKTTTTPFPQSPKTTTTPFPQRPTVTTTPFPQRPAITTTPFPQSPKTTTAPLIQRPATMAPFPQSPAITTQIPTSITQVLNKITPTVPQVPSMINSTAPRVPAAIQVPPVVNPNAPRVPDIINLPMPRIPSVTQVPTGIRPNLPSTFNPNAYSQQ